METRELSLSERVVRNLEHARARANHGLVCDCRLCKDQRDRMKDRYPLGWGPNWSVALRRNAEVLDAISDAYELGDMVSEALPEAEQRPISMFRRPPPSHRVAENVRRLRRYWGASQEHLAATVQHQSGQPMHQSTVAKIEKGERQVSVDELFSLAAALRVSPWMLCRSAGDRPTERPCPVCGALETKAV